MIAIVWPSTGDPTKARMPEGARRLRYDCPCGARLWVAEKRGWPVAILHFEWNGDVNVAPAAYLALRSSDQPLSAGEGCRDRCGRLMGSAPDWDEGEPLEPLDVPPPFAVRLEDGFRLWGLR